MSEEKIILKVLRQIGLHLFEGIPEYRATVRIGITSPTTRFREIGKMFNLSANTPDKLEKKIGDLKKALEKAFRDNPDMLKKFGTVEELELKLE